MDILDIILARAKSFTGETATLTQQAQAAMADANDIVSRLEAIESDTQTANEVATAAAEAATTAAASFDEMKEDLNAAAASLVGTQIEDALGEVNGSLSDLGTRTEVLENQIQNAGGSITFNDNNTSAAKVKEANVTKNGSTSTYVVEKNYTSYGDNEDGSMTQKAIKQYITNVKTELQNQINAIPTGGNGGSGTTNLGSNNAGYIVVIDANGNIISGNTTEASIINALLKSGSYTARNAIGVEFDYVNKTYTRTQEASGKSAGVDFNEYPMYGGRMRCNVADDGSITAWYGDAAYKEDGSNGQVMVYQPKFYYCRIPIEVAGAPLGSIVKKEIIIISTTSQSGFKIHPIFKLPNDEELEYVLISAYDGSIYRNASNEYDAIDNSDINFNNDKLCSIANVKPASGVNKNLTVVTAERLAQNRGNGWHITNMAAESMAQMLEMVEFGTPNCQNAFEAGLVDLPNVSGKNCASHTGSTSSLGNTSGNAISTLNITNNISNTYSDAGKRAISYRGVENPWGNIFHFIGGVNIYGDGSKQGGLPYICTDFDYDITKTGNNYQSIGFYLPSSSNWISGFGIGSLKYDWIFLPAETNSTANSYAPIGDFTWTISDLNEMNTLIVGGSSNGKDYAGPFCYGADNISTVRGRATGARLMFIPQKNAIYEANYEAWLAKWEG